MGNYAIPLFSLIDRNKVDLSEPLPESLAEQLHLYLRDQFQIHSISAKLLRGGEYTYLVLHEVDEESLPKLIALVDVQKSQLFRYERKGEDEVQLTPLAVKPG